MSFDITVTRRLGDADITLVCATGPGATVLFGPSGVGKTSVLNMVAGLLRPDRGLIRVDGATMFDAAAGIDVRPEHRRAGYVFQEARLFPHLTVRANLLYGAVVETPGRGPEAKARGPEAKARGPEAKARGDVWLTGELDFLGIGHLLDRWPRSLSGGEARRVAIGRAVLRGPAFLLLDEPLASLDAARREEISRAIEHIRDGLKLPILLVTHDAGEAERLGTQIVAM